MEKKTAWWRPSGDRSPSGPAPAWKARAELKRAPRRGFELSLDCSFEKVNGTRSRARLMPRCCHLAVMRAPSGKRKKGRRTLLAVCCIDEVPEARNERELDAA